MNITRFLKVIEKLYANRSQWGWLDLTFKYFLIRMIFVVFPYLRFGMLTLQRIKTCLWVNPNMIWNVLLYLGSRIITFATKYCLLNVRIVCNTLNMIRYYIKYDVKWTIGIVEKRSFLHITVVKGFIHATVLSDKPNVKFSRVIFCSFQPINDEFKVKWWIWINDRKIK